MNKIVRNIVLLFLITCPIFGQQKIDFNRQVSNKLSQYITHSAGITNDVDRTAEAKMREMAPSVLDFGAKGDGVTDDSAAFQAAIDAVANGMGWLFVPETGNPYIVNNVVLKSYINIFGVGQYNKSRLQCSTPGNKIFSIDTSSDHKRFINIRGLSFRGSGCKAIYDQKVVDNFETAKYFQNNVIENNYFRYDLAHGIYGNLILNHIRGNVFGFCVDADPGCSGLPDGIPTEWITIRGNLNGLAANANEIYRNIIHAADGAYAIKADSALGVKIYSNNIEGNFNMTDGAAIIISGSIFSDIYRNWIERNAGDACIVFKNDEAESAGNRVMQVRGNFFDIYYQELPPSSGNWVGNKVIVETRGAAAYNGTPQYPAGLDFTDNYGNIQTSRVIDTGIVGNRLQRYRSATPPYSYSYDSISLRTVRGNSFLEYPLSSQLASAVSDSATTLYMLAVEDPSPVFANYVPGHRVYANGEMMEVCAVDKTLKTLTIGIFNGACPSLAGRGLFGSARTGHAAGTPVLASYPQPKASRDMGVMDGEQLTLWSNLYTKGNFGLGTDAPNLKMEIVTPWGNGFRVTSKGNGINISNIVSGTPITVTTTLAHGLSTGDTIELAGAYLYTTAQYIIDVTGTYTFTLRNSTPANMPDFTTGTAYRKYLAMQMLAQAEYPEFIFYDKYSRQSAAVRGRTGNPNPEGGAFIVYDNNGVGTLYSVLQDGTLHARAGITLQKKGSEVPISSAEIVSGPLLKITTSSSHGLSTGDLVQISGASINCVAAFCADGPRNVTIIDATSFTVDSSGSVTSGSFTVPPTAPFISAFVAKLTSTFSVNTDGAVTAVSGGNVPTCTKYNVTYSNAAFTAASTTADVTLFTLPARGKITGMNIKHSYQFMDGAGPMSQVAVSVGDGSTHTAYSAAQNIGEATAVADTTFTDTAQFKSTTMASSSVVARFTATGANFGTGSVTNLVGGSVDIVACWVILP